MIVFQNLHFLMFGPFPNGPLGGLALTLILSLLVGFGSLAFGLVVTALMMSGLPMVPVLMQWLTTVVRSLPSLVFLFWLYFLLPAMIGVPMTPLQSAAIALSIYHGAFIAEDIRGGFRAVGKGQAEAARATGLSAFAVFWNILLPQALRATAPALVNRYVNIFLYTSVASVVGVLEFSRASTLVNNRVLIYPIQIFGFSAIIYFLFCYAISMIGRYVERKWDWAPKIAQGSAAL